jgi:hypothetical protein
VYGAKLPERLANIALSGQNGPCINGELAKVHRTEKLRDEAANVTILGGHHKFSSLYE